MLQDLLVFARKTSTFRSVGDFRADQILYDKNRGWILFDWLKEHTVFNKKKLHYFDSASPDIFGGIDGMGKLYYLKNEPPQIQKWVSDVINLARNSIADQRGLTLYNGRYKTGF